jgi:cation:H+ antiporter
MSEAMMTGPAVLASLLPSDWFVHAGDAAGSLESAPLWHTLMLCVIAVVTMAMVIKGADWLGEGAAGVAGRLGMPNVVIGATIVSLGTTSPETAVSVLAAFSGEPDLALGNGVGSIIADTGLIFGLGCLLASNLPADRYILVRQGWVQFASGSLLTAWCVGKFLIDGRDAQLHWYFGVACLAALAWYLWVSVRWARGRRSTERERVGAVAGRKTGAMPGVPHADDSGAEGPGVGDPGVDDPGMCAKPQAAGEAGDALEAGHAHAAERSWGALIVMGVVGLAMVLFAGDAFVQCVTVLAERWGVPKVVIAATIVALGTSLPELVVGLTAVFKGHGGLMVGNVIGADILNVLWVIGLSSIGGAIAGYGLPIVSGEGFPLVLGLQLPMMMAMLILFRLFIVKANRDGRFSRWMGAPMVGLYVAFLVLNFVLS